MTTPSFTGDTVFGFAELLAGSDLFTWRADAPYTDGEIGIYVDAAPTDPDAVVVLALTWLDAEPTLSDSTGNLQVRTRSGPNSLDVYAMDDAAQDQLLGRYPITLPTGVRISKLKYVNGGSLGPDENQRQQRSSNWQFVAHRPGPHRR